LICTSSQCAGPVLTPEQIQAAIQQGSKYKTLDKFLAKGLKGKRVRLAGAMALDGISKYATFFNDLQAVAAEAAIARQQKRELKADEVQMKGLLHAYVEVHARGVIPTSKMKRRYRERKALLVLQVGNRVIEPVENTMIRKSNQPARIVIVGDFTFAFAFDVSPEDLKAPVMVTLIDGDGHRHRDRADLKGILDY
jgi:hypothetical protein